MNGGEHVGIFGCNIWQNDRRQIRALGAHDRLRIEACDFWFADASTDDHPAIQIFDGHGNARIEACQLQGFGTNLFVPSGVTVNGHGVEVAGAGNSPTVQGNRMEGDIVTSTDDGTVWLLNRDNTWTQVSWPL